MPRKSETTMFILIKIWDCQLSAAGLSCLLILRSSAAFPLHLGAYHPEISSVLPMDSDFSE